MKRILALVLALTLLLAVCVSAGAATKATKKTKIRDASAVLYKDGFSLKYSWKRVTGANGYEYCYNQNYNGIAVKSEYTFVTTDKTSAEIKLGAYGNVDFRVRAYADFGGERIYGPWVGCRLKQGKVDKLIVKQVKKRMKTNSLFMKATSPTANVFKKAGTKYDIIGEMKYLDENRATGDFKRDKKGNWWIRVYFSPSQNKTTKGWVLSDNVQAMWY